MHTCVSKPHLRKMPFPLLLTTRYCLPQGLLIPPLFLRWSVFLGIPNNQRCVGIFIRSDLPKLNGIPIFESWITIAQVCAYSVVISYHYSYLFHLHLSTHVSCDLVMHTYLCIPLIIPPVPNNASFTFQ